MIKIVKAEDLQNIPYPEIIPYDEGIRKRGFAPDLRKSVLSRVRYESCYEFVGNPIAEKTHYPT